MTCSRCSGSTTAGICDCCAWEQKLEIIHLRAVLDAIYQDCRTDPGLKSYIEDALTRVAKKEKVTP